MQSLALQLKLFYGVISIVKQHQRCSRLKGKLDSDSTQERSESAGPEVEKKQNKNRKGR